MHYASYLTLLYQLERVRQTVILPRVRTFCGFAAALFWLLRQRPKNFTSW